MKKLLVAAAVIFGLTLTDSGTASAQDHYYYADGTYYQSATPYAAPANGLILEELVVVPLMVIDPVLRPARHTAGDVAQLYLNLNPAAQVAEDVGLINRNFIVDLIRGF